MLEFLRSAPPAPASEPATGARETAQPRHAPAAPAAPAQNDRSGTEKAQEGEPEKTRARPIKTTGAAGAPGQPHNHAQKPAPAATEGTGAAGATARHKLAPWPPGAPLLLPSWLTLPKVTCGECRHHQPDPLNPAQGVGDCVHDTGRGPSLRPMVPRVCAAYESCVSR